MKYRPACTLDQGDERLEAQEELASDPQATDGFAGQLVMTPVMKSLPMRFAGYPTVFCEMMLLVSPGKKASAKTDSLQKSYWAPPAKTQEPPEKRLPVGY